MIGKFPFHIKITHLNNTNKIAWSTYTESTVPHRRTSRTHPGVERNPCCVTAGATHQQRLPLPPPSQFPLPQVEELNSSQHPPPQSPSRSSTSSSSSSSSWRRRKNPATYKYTPPHPHADLTAAALPSSSPLATSPRLNPPKPTVPSRRRGSARWWWGRCTSTTSGCRRRWRMRRHGSPRRSPARWGRRGRRGDPTTRTPPTPRSSGSPSSTCKNLSLSLPSPSPPLLFCSCFLGYGGGGGGCF